MQLLFQRNGLVLARCSGPIFLLVGCAKPECLVLSACAGMPSVLTACKAELCAQARYHGSEAAQSCPKEKQYMGVASTQFGFIPFGVHEGTVSMSMFEVL
ncbi:unnamed protein product [Durusdinium trenchii]|uniref:Uncharacterized protein n=1 Tax=Durusdinium trenchii TaxID=1381693 RepID=A0ABP0MS39_9DINO